MKLRQLSFFHSQTARKLLELMLPLILAFAFNWYCIEWSRAHGKLAVPPDYDDSHSLVEGAVRLAVWQNEGILGVWNDYLQRPPHSFLHYYWTAFLFAVFGVSAAAPYYANFLFLWAVLWTFYRLLPELPIMVRIAWGVAFLCLPVSFHLIHDYRSEVTMAAILFVACGFVLRAPDHGKKRWLFLLVAGALIALAIGMKPAMFPYPLGILGLCFLVLCGFRLANKEWSWGPVFCDAAVLVGAATIPVLPHFIFHSSSVLGYIWRVVFATEYYHIPADKGASWLFHWLGYSGEWHLGGMRMVLVLLVFALGVGGIIAMRSRRFADFSLGSRWYGLAFLTVGAFAGIAVNSVEQPFFGMTFQLLLLACSLIGLAHLFLQETLWWLVVLLCGALGGYYWVALLTRDFLVPAAGIAAIVIAGCFACRISLQRWPGFLGSVFIALLCWRVNQIAPYNNYVARTIQEVGESGLEWRRQGPGLLWNKLNPLWRRDGAPVVWFASYGWVDANTVSWEAALAGKPWKMLNYLELPPADQLGIPPQADIVVVAEPGITGEISFPQQQRAQAVWHSISENKEFSLFAEIQAPCGKRLQIYQRLELPLSKNTNFDSD